MRPMSALAGNAGTWLLDPLNVTIVVALPTPPTGVFTATAGNTQIAASTIAAFLSNTLTGGNVTINTGVAVSAEAGNITFASGAAITVANGNNRTLTLNAANNIVVSEAISVTIGAERGAEREHSRRRGEQRQ